MRTKPLFPILLAMLSVLGSCTSDDFESATDAVKSDNKVAINFIKPTFEGEEPETRASVVNSNYYDNSAFESTWDKDDVVGICDLTLKKYPNVKLPVGGNNVSFINAEEGEYLYAYFPYNADLKKTNKVPFDLREQMQNGNNDLDHLRKYNYMYGNIQIKNNVQTLKMKQVFGLLKIKMTLPNAATWDKLTLRSLSYKKYFTVSGEYSMYSGSIQTGNTAVKPKTMTLDLKTSRQKLLVKKLRST